jgi:hypothetical protein
MIGYPLDRLRQEVVYLALHCHWSYDVLMNMEHEERGEWVQDISRTIGEANRQAKGAAFR